MPGADGTGLPLAQFNGGTKAWILSPGTDRYVLTVPSVSVRNYFETNPETAILATAAFGGEKQFGDWKVAPEVFYSEGHNNRPNHIEASARINQSDKYTSGSKIPLGGQSWAIATTTPSRCTTRRSSTPSTIPPACCPRAAPAS
jgi:hypothetical protein